MVDNKEVTLLRTITYPLPRHFWRWFSFSPGGTCWFPGEYVKFQGCNMNFLDTCFYPENCGKLIQFWRAYMFFNLGNSPPGKVWILQIFIYIPSGEPSHIPPKREKDNHRLKSELVKDLLVPMRLWFSSIFPSMKGATWCKFCWQNEINSFWQGWRRCMSQARGNDVRGLRPRCRGSWTYRS